MQRKNRSCAGAIELRDGEQRVMRPRQAVHRQHAEHCRQRGEQHRHLEDHRNERRPAVERPAAHVERISDDGRVVLHAPSRQRSRRFRQSAPPAASACGEIRSPRPVLPPASANTLRRRDNRPRAFSRSRHQLVGVGELGQHSEIVRRRRSCRCFVPILPPSRAFQKSKSSAGSG